MKIQSTPPLTQTIWNKEKKLMKKSILTFIFSELVDFKTVSEEKKNRSSLYQYIIGVFTAPIINIVSCILTHFLFMPFWRENSHVISSLITLCSAPHLFLFIFISSPLLHYSGMLLQVPIEPSILPFLIGCLNWILWSHWSMATNWSYLWLNIITFKWCHLSQKKTISEYLLHHQQWNNAADIYYR